MRDSSAFQENRTSRTELNVLLQRLVHLTKGRSVLSQGNVVEAGEVTLRPSEQLLSALRMIDVLFELFDLERVGAVNSNLHIENMKNEYEELIDRERKNVRDLRNEIDMLKAENEELRSTLMQVAV